ncbi:inositol phosphorylceramide synthase [Candidatus Bathyarchaeota archaeon]|nr:inositol phosphorylceramide synthase [Candidatus Bathyarchaeota archaeon]
MDDATHREKVKVDKGLRINDRFLFNLARRFPIIYSVALIIFCLVYRVFPAPDFLALCLFIYAAHMKRAHRFIKDWFPFMALLLAYDTMRGIAYKIAGIVHVTEPINAELYLFGTIPTKVLQQFYRTPILDWAGAFFYSLHFVIPFVFGFVLWYRSPKNYRKYTVALLITSYSALITFLAYPAAPPWFGINAERILFQMDGVMGVPLYATIYAFIEPNPFAAIPSLHAAYPWVVSLYAIKIKRIKALPILIFPLGVWFSAVYLGEHYIIDLLAGVAYSTVAYFLAEKLTERYSFSRSLCRS